MKEEFQIVDDALAFDFDTKAWRAIAKPKHGRLSAELVALGGKLYLAGGSSPHGGKDITPDRSVEVYDPITNTWKTVLEDLPFDTKHMRMFSVRRAPARLHRAPRRPHDRNRGHHALTSEAQASPPST